MKTKTTKTVLLIIAFAMGSKVLGFIRETLIAYLYGAGSGTDAFFVSLVAISVFTLIITDTVNTTLIPVLSEIETKEGKSGKVLHLNNFLNITIISALALTVIGWIGAPLLLKFTARNFKGEQMRLAIELTRLGLPSIFFASITGVFRGYLQSEGLFNETTISLAVRNLVFIVLLVIVSPFFDIRALMVVQVIASAVPILLQLYVLRSINYKYEWTFDIHDSYMGKVLAMIPSILIGVGVADISKLINNSMATSLVEGSVSALNYAAKLETITTGIFISAIITVVFPMLSKAANKENLREFKDAIVSGVNIIIIITIPAMVGMIVLSYPIVKLAFERGKFDAVATAMTVGALVFYCLGLLGVAIRNFLNRAFYSLQDTKTPLLNSAIAVVVNVILNVILIKSMKHQGLALSSSIASTVTALLLITSLTKKIGSVGFKSSFIVGIKASISSALMGFVVYYSYNFLLIKMGSGTVGMLSSLLASVLIGVLIYFVGLLIFKVNEVHEMISMIKNRKKSV